MIPNCSFGQKRPWGTLGTYIPAVARAAPIKVTRWPAASTLATRVTYRARRQCGSVSSPTCPSWKCPPPPQRAQFFASERLWSTPLAASLCRLVDYHTSFGNIGFGSGLAGWPDLISSAYGSSGHPGSLYSHDTDSRPTWLHSAEPISQSHANSPANCYDLFCLTTLQLASVGGYERQVPTRFVGIRKRLDWGDQSSINERGGCVCVWGRGEGR